MKNVKKLLAKVAELREEISTKFVAMSETLLDAYETGEATLADLQEAAGVGPRRVRQLMDIAKAIRAEKLSEADAISLGATRAGLVATALLKDRVSADDVPNLMSLKTGALTKVLNQSFEGQVGQRVVMTFHFTEAERDAVNAALVQFGALRHASGLRCKEQALLTILVRAQSAVARKPDLKAA